MNDFNLCLVVPHYNHVDAFKAFLPRLIALKLPCIVVDDGSQAQTKIALAQMLDNVAGFQLLQHAENSGKGAAMVSGAQLARHQGFTHMLQIDADGQHNTDDIAEFVRYSKVNPTHIVSGAPVFDASAPKARLYGRKVTDFWVALETWSLAVKDSLCGFRVYPLQEFNDVLDQYNIGLRMDFDTEILVKSVWSGVPLHFIPTNVIYPQNSVSHFHYLRDNVRLIGLHIRLMVGMLLRSPKLLKLRLAEWSSRS